MKSAIGFGLLSIALLFFSGCPTIDPLKDLPQTEYDQAQKYRARIAKYHFDQYAPDEFQSAENSFKDGEGNMKKDNLAAKKSLDEANADYKVVMQKGIAAARKVEDDQISAVREKADEIKAPVAAAAEYKDAKDTYDKAAELADAENWEEAQPLFQEAKRKYETAYETAKTKKEKADAQFEKTQKAKDALDAQQGGEQAE
ncbi:MAG: hypothetical protein JXD23_13675 [Spirochaetales bacterium]|nr:hypothetical protein [Spirochaetales bacterium]